MLSYVPGPLYIALHPSLLHGPSAGTGIDGSSSSTGFSFGVDCGFATGAVAATEVSGVDVLYVSVPSFDTVGAATSGTGLPMGVVGFGGSVEWRPVVQGGMERNSSNVRT